MSDGEGFEIVYSISCEDIESILCERSKLQFSEYSDHVHSDLDKLPDVPISDLKSFYTNLAKCNTLTRVYNFFSQASEIKFQSSTSLMRKKCEGEITTARKKIEEKIGQKNRTTQPTTNEFSKKTKEIKKSVNDLEKLVNEQVEAEKRKKEEERRKREEEEKRKREEEEKRKREEERRKREVEEQRKREEEKRKREVEKRKWEEEREIKEREEKQKRNREEDKRTREVEKRKRDEEREIKEREEEDRKRKKEEMEVEERRKRDAIDNQKAKNIVWICDVTSSQMYPIDNVAHEIKLNILRQKIPKKYFTFLMDDDPVTGSQETKLTVQEICYEMDGKSFISLSYDK